MDKIKYLIISGGLLILAGLVLKFSAVTGPWATLCFSVGGTLKLLYLVLGVRFGLLKLGGELVLLFIGLAFVFTAVYFRRTEQFLDLYAWLLGLGVFIKALFIIIFMKRQRQFRKSLAVE